MRRNFMARWVLWRDLYPAPKWRYVIILHQTSKLHARLRGRSRNNGAWAVHFQRIWIRIQMAPELELEPFVWKVTAAPMYFIWCYATILLTESHNLSPTLCKIQNFFLFVATFFNWPHYYRFDSWWVEQSQDYSCNDGTDYWLTQLTVFINKFTGARAVISINNLQEMEQIYDKRHLRSWSNLRFTQGCND